MEFLRGVFQLLRIVAAGIAYVLGDLFRGNYKRTVRLTDSIQPQEVHMEVITKLLSSRRVWLAGLALVVTVLGVAFPQLPPSVVQAAQTFAVILIAAFTIDDTAATIKGS